MSFSNPIFDDKPANMDEDAFVARFGGVYEHSPWIARATWQAGLDNAHDSAEGLSQAMAAIVETASREQLIKLIKAHPDLAGKAAINGELTADSSSEQSSAGIDQCTPDEFDRFHVYNAAYKDKFGFPFIMAVKGSNRHKILAAFEERLENDAETEFKTAINEINKIARLRLVGLAEEV